MEENKQQEKVSAQEAVVEANVDATPEQPVDKDAGATEDGSLVQEQEASGKQPAMYRSSLEAPDGPVSYPTFLSNLSRSFWD